MPLDYIEFSKTIKKKYPQYKDVDDYTLATKMVEKYPEYKDKVILKKKESTASQLPPKKADTGFLSKQAPALSLLDSSVQTKQKPSASSGLKPVVNKAAVPKTSEVYTNFPGKEKNEYRIIDDNWQKKEPNKEWVTIKHADAIINLNNQYKKTITPSDNFEKITSKVIDKSEEDVVPFLQNNYGHLGFSFQESGLGDRVEVMTEDGMNSDTFFLDNWTDEGDSSEALRLKAFLKENTKTMDREKYTKLDQEIDAINLNKPKKELSYDPYAVKNDAFSKQKAGLTSDVALPFEEQLKLKGKEKEAIDYNKGRMHSLIVDLNAAKKTGTKKDDEFVRARIAESYGTRNTGEIEKQNRYISNNLNDIARMSTGLKQRYDKYESDVDAFKSKLDQEGGIMTEELATQKAELEGQASLIDSEKKYLDENIDGIKKTSRDLNKISAEYLLSQESKGSTGGAMINSFIKEALSIARFAGLEKSSQEELVKALGSEYTTKEYMGSDKRSGFEQVLFGLSGSLGSLVSGGIAGKAAATGSFFSQSYFGMKDEMNADPDFDKVPEGEKQLLSTVYGLTIGWLEKFGIDKIISKTPVGKTIMNKILTLTIKGLPKGAPAELIEQAVSNNVKALIAKGAINVAGGYLVEGTTEGLQDLAGNTIKEVYNAAKEKELFKTPDSLLASAWENAVLGGLGGVIMQTPIQAVDILKSGLSSKNSLQADIIEKSVSSVELKSMLVSNIKTQIINKDITKQEGEDQIKAINESASIFQKIPDGISDIGRAKSFDLLVERSNIEKEIEGKDVSLVAPQKNRITEINNELTKISEDAVQKQATSEVPVQPEAKVGEGVEEGKPKAEPEVVAEEVGKEEVESINNRILKIEEAATRGALLEDSELGELKKLKDRKKELESTPEAVIEQPTTTDQVKTLRAEEQAELSDVIPNIEDYKVDGEVDKTLMTPDDLVKYNKVYDKYDKLITPLLPATEEIVPGKRAVVSGIEITYPTEEQKAERVAARSTAEFVETASQDLPIEDVNILSEELGGEFGVLTAENPLAQPLTDQENKSLNQKAIQWLESRGYKPRRATGKYDQGENSFFVPNLSKEDAIAFAIEFNQESVAHSEGLIYQDGSMNPRDKSSDDFSFSEYNPESNFVSVVRTPDGLKTFSIGYDFANKIPASKPKTGPTIEQEVEAIGQMLSGTDQEIDQKASKIANKKIVKAVAKAKKALSKIIPGTKFVVHNTNEEYQKAVGEDARSQASNGTFDIDTNTIHINGTNANARTIAHEVFHAILINKVGLSNASAVTKKMVEAIASKIDNNTELKKKLENFISRYEENIQNEEKLAELVGMLAENYNSFSTSVKDIITRWINKLAGIFGLDPFNSNETYDMLKTIAKKVAKGKVISEADVKVFKGGEKVNSPSEGLTSRKQYGNKNVRLEVRYLEQERMDELIKNKLVQEVSDLSTLNGQRVVTTSPDDMLVGSIYVNGKEVATGNGGIFFVTKFGDVWANSNKGVAKGLASAINEASRANGGKAYLALVKGSDAKLVSSPQGVTSSLAVTESLLDAGLFSLSDFRSAIRTAVKDAGGNIILSQNGSAKTLKNELDSFFSDVTASTFEKRGNVLKAIIANLAKSESASGNKTDIIKFLNGDTSKGLGVGVTAKSQSLVDLVAKVSAEQLTKGLNTGDIYGVIEINGEVDIFEDQHQSYPYHIKMVDKNGKISSEKPVLILPKNRKNGREILTSVDGQTSTDLGTGFAGKVGATANMPYGKGIIQDGSTEPAPRKQLSPEVSSKLTEDKNGNFVFHHYSNDKRNEIKPGTGENIITGKEEGGALSAVGGLAMYYTMDNQVEPGVGNVQHTVLVPNDKVYDFNQDPETFYDEAKKRFEAARPSQSFSPNYQLAFITQVANENGYDMVVARWRNNELRAQTTMSLDASKDNVPMKPIAEEVYKVGDYVEVFGSKGKITSIEGNIITFKGDGVGGQIDFKRFPKEISHNITPRKQIAEEVVGIEQTISPRKQKPKSINDIVKLTKDQGFSDAAIRQYLKDQGYSDKQSTAAINEYNVKKEGIFVKRDGGIPTKIADSIKSFKRRMFSARAFLPKSVFSARENKEASVARHLNIVDQNVKDFNRLYSKYKGDKKKLVEEFDKYIRGDKDAKMSDEFLAVANSMRNQIDGLSIQLINSGLVDESMANKIKDNIGQYLTRSYKIYDRANWKKEVEEEVKQKAINLLKSQYKEMAQDISEKESIPLGEALDNLVTNRLDEMLTTEGASNFITGSKLGAKDLSVLKKLNTEIPIEIRMLLGEYSDPALNYAKTVLKLSSLAANHKFLTDIKKSGMGTYFYEKNDPRRPADFNTMIATEGSETMNPLNGLYTTKEIAEAFMAQPSQLSDFWKTFMKFQSSIRWLKTIGSIATHIKNVFGNIGFVWINAHFDPKEVGRAFMTVKNDFSKGTNQQRRDKMNNYISLGIVKQSAGLGEVMDMFKDANWDTAMASRLSNEKIGLMGKAKRLFLQGKKKIEDAYQAEDDFFKIIAYENELSRYSKAMFDKSKNELTESELAEVNNVVTEIVKNTYPTYDRIPEAIKMVRRAPFIGNFVSFQAESYRTAFNTMALAKNELTSKNKKIQTIGAQRLAGATTYLSAKSAILAYFSMAAGTGLTGLAGYLFDDEDEEKRDKDIREFVAPWSKKSDLLMVSVGDGKIKYIDFSSSDPHGALKKVMNAFFLGETTIQGFSDGIVETFSPFIGEDMTVEALLALKNNQDKYGNPIYNSEESLEDQSQKVLAYMYKLVEPGTFSSIRRGWEAEDKANELVANLTGFRTYDVDVNQQFGYKMKDLSDRISNAKKIYNSKYYNEKATDAEKKAAYDKSNEALKKIYSDVISVYNSAERLGCKPEDLGVTMKEFGGMSKENITEIQSGKAPELKKKEEEDKAVKYY